MKLSERLHKANGYFWVSIISIIAAPLAYYRSLILGQTTNDGSLVGMYSVALIFIEIISTFVLIGGGTVITTYLPKLISIHEKSTFLTRYATMNLLLLLFLSILAMVVPGISALVDRLAEYQYGVYPLLVLGPFTLLSVMLIFALSGAGVFTLSGFLTNVQLLLICLVSTAFFFVNRELFVSNGIPVFIATIVAAQTLIIVIASLKLGRMGFRLSLGGAFPKGFSRFAIHIHINSICNFTYRTGDQIFVLGALGIKELGAYFIAIQLADLINLLPLRTSQIMLAKFSGMIRDKNHSEVTATYALLTKVISCIAGSCALFLIFFSVPIASIFGEWASEKASYLQLLAFIAVLGCLNSVNSMLIMASETTSYYLLTNIIQMLLQLAATFVLIGPWQVYGVIGAKLLGMLVLQTGLVLIIRSGLGELNIKVSWHYYFTVATVLAAVLILQYTPISDVTSSVAGFTIFMAFYHLVLGVRPKDFRRLILRH